MKNLYTVFPADKFIWNLDEVLTFLIANQHKDIVLRTNEEGCCAESAGLYKLLDLFNFNSVTILTGNTFEQHNKYIIKPDSPFKFFDVDHTDYDALHKWNGNKIFGVFYNRPLWHRIGIASYLNIHHNDRSLVNFRSNPHYDMDRRLFEMQTLFETDLQSVDNVIKSIGDFPMQLETTDGYTTGASTTDHVDQLSQFYTNIFIDIVAETFVSGRTFFATEKTVRPMLLKKPFIAM